MRTTAPLLAAAILLSLGACSRKTNDEASAAANSGVEDLDRTADKAVADTDAAMAAAGNGIANATDNAADETGNALDNAGNAIRR